MPSAGLAVAPADVSARARVLNKLYDDKRHYSQHYRADKQRTPVVLKKFKHMLLLSR